MCEKYKRTFYGVRRDFVQWSIHWFKFDKVRPGLVISNNWFNSTQTKIIVLPITSVDKSDNKCSEWDDAFVPFINNNGDINYIKLTNITWFDIIDLDSENNKLIGYLTDEFTKSKITEFMSNICNPMYKAEEISFDYQLKDGKLNNKPSISTVESKSSNTNVQNVDSISDNTPVKSIPKLINKEDTSKKWSRKKIARPDNWDEVYNKYLSKEISSAQCCIELGISNPTFYRMRKAYEEEHSTEYPLKDLRPIYDKIIKSKENTKEIMDKISKISIFGDELVIKDSIIDDDYILKTLILSISMSPSIFKNRYNYKFMTRLSKTLVKYCYDHKLINDELFIQLNNFVINKYIHKSTKENFFE